MVWRMASWTVTFGRRLSGTGKGDDGVGVARMAENGADMHTIISVPTLPSTFSILVLFPTSMLWYDLAVVQHQPYMPCHVPCTTAGAVRTRTRHPFSLALATWSYMTKRLGWCDGGQT
jgi:hypothetical protein